VKSLTLEEFNLAIKSFVPILIEFWSQLCTACENAEQYLEKLELVYRGKMIVARVDINNLSLNQLNDVYSINKLPTFILFKNSIELVRVTGFRNEIELEKAIRQYLK
jgi:thioredoxin 1